MIRAYDLKDFESCIDLLQELNPTLDRALLNARYKNTLTQENYQCYVYEEQGKVIAMFGLWMMFRVYCGKQYEIDHFIILDGHRTKGIGTKMLHFIENLAAQNQIIAIELNAYVQSNLAHQFYFKHGFKILGFHFHKKLNHD